MRVHALVILFKGKRVEKTYNGWTNYETWLASLWIDNDWRMSESFALQSGDLLGSYERDEAIERLAARIDEFLESTRPETSAGFFDDLINTGLREVNTREIARHYVESWPDESEGE
jgi:hypothetical protein